MLITFYEPLCELYYTVSVDHKTDLVDAVQNDLRIPVLDHGARDGTNCNNIARIEVYNGVAWIPADATTKFDQTRQTYLTPCQIRMGFVGLDLARGKRALMVAFSRFFVYQGRSRVSAAPDLVPGDYRLRLNAKDEL